MDETKRPASHLASVATVPSAHAPRRAAFWFCAVAGAITACLLPLAAEPGPTLPGFALINQSALISAYSLSAWVLFAQFRRARSVPLLLIAAGTFYTAIIVALQLASLPGVVTGTRLLGAGSETTVWLWTFWHLGPPTCGIAYALAVEGGRAAPLAPGREGLFTALAASAALAAAWASAGVSTLGLAWLPHQVTGDDYGDVTRSGVGPVVEVVTIAALATVWRATRLRRSALDLWIAVSLLLLALDNLLTLAGGARGTIGWYAGRTEATVSAFVILWAYFHEVDALRTRAEAAADELIRTGAALREAQKMEAVGRLTAGIAHDFNNLLTIVTSGFDMIRRRPDDRGRVLMMAEAGLKAAERGTGLTRQLLTFARRHDLRPETVNLNASLIAFETLGRRALGEAAEIRMELDPALHPARVDPSEFESAMLNLIVNARDAVDGTNGRIVIRTRNMEQSGGTHGEVRDLVPPGSYVVVAVSDDGCGMDEATRLQAFEPFFTTKEFGKGSGLGLSQVYGFARAAGGAVDIVSAPGAGTTVEIWLPRTQSVESPLAPANGPASPLRRAQTGETVLAVEDEPAVLSAIIENLTDLGYRVIAARDASMALELLQGPQSFDILFSDIVMPGGMNGVELARKAARLRPGLKVLLTSGYTDEALKGEHNVPPSVPVLAKPYCREALAERLAAAWRAAG